MESDNDSLRVFISAGELSGDMHAARLVEALRARIGDIQFIAIGSVNLVAAGAEVLYDTAKTSALGVISNAFRAPANLSLFQDTVKYILGSAPDAVILVDWRFFNLNLARVLRQRGYEGAIVHYVAPVLWQAASDARYQNIAAQPQEFQRAVGKRFEQLRKNVDLSIVIYPVGLELYEHYGVNYEFVGHPLCETVKPTISRDELRKLVGAQPHSPVIGLMPGSRKEEVAVIGREFIGAARIIIEQMPDTCFALPVAHPSLRANILAMLKKLPVNITLLEPELRYDLICHSDLMIVASGTATHECAAAGVPHIMAYRLHPALDFIYSSFTRFRMPAYAFPNIIAGRNVVPELIRSECNAGQIAGTAMSLLDDEGELNRMREGLGEVRSRICRPGTLARSAELVLEAIARRMG
jgi:lipid-A-disaccharide synthase